ncbi:type VI secretion system-associated protein TagO [Enterobacter asburiae]
MALIINKDNQMKKYAFTVGASFIALSALSAHATNEHKNFNAVLECRGIENNTDRLSCYDKSIPPARTANAQKFESRDQCPDEKDDDKRLFCYDRFFSPTFKSSTSSKTSTSIAADIKLPDRAALSACQNEVNGTKRLACYDRLLPQSTSENNESVETAAANPGKWQTSITTSPVDDSKNVILSLSSNDTITTPFGESVIPSIYVACREKQTDVFINWDVYLGLEQTSMLYRLDKQKAVEKQWSISTDTKAVFYRGNDIEFVKALAKAEKLFTRITPYNEAPVTATFDLAGLSEAMKPLQKACGWK